MYENIVDTNLNGDCVTWDGKTGVDCSGYLLHTDSAETHLALKYGAALCNPCDISGLATDPGDPNGIFDKCLCRVPLPAAVFRLILNLFVDGEGNLPNDIVEDMALVGLGPQYLLLPWHILQSPDSWNANNITYNTQVGGRTPSFATDLSVDQHAQTTLCYSGGGCDQSGCCNIGAQTDMSGFQFFNKEPSSALLPCISDNSGASQLPSLYGAYLCNLSNPNIFGDACAVAYYPEGTAAFTLQEAIGAWLYLWEPIVMRGGAGTTGGAFVTALQTGRV